MKSRSFIPAVAFIVLSLFLAACTNYSNLDNDELAVIETNYGRIVIEFFPTDAPKHVQNFKELARRGFYDGTKFHRLVKDKNKPVAIQGGDPNTISGDPSTWGKGQPYQQKVPAEFSATLKHERGIVSAARRGNDVDSATSQFFICVSPAPEWDGNYTIYGRVVEGMNVVDTIARAPLWARSDRPLDPVVVSKVYLMRRGEGQ